MLHSRRYSSLLIALVITLLMTACGSNSSSSSSGGSRYGSTGSAVTPTPTIAATASVSTPVPSPSPSLVIVISTGMATVSGTTKTVLTNSAGMTLYYSTDDTTTTALCTGGCATNWPPLLVNGVPGSNVTLTGLIGALMDSNGNQVQYNGHFLYTFVGDTAPGQAHGEGIGGKWYVATPDLQSGGYGY